MEQQEETERVEDILALALEARTLRIRDKARVLDVILKARILLSDASRWAPGIFNRDADGNLTDFWDERTTRWCLLGAVVEMTSPKPADEAARALAQSTIDDVRVLFECVSYWQQGRLLAPLPPADPDKYYTYESVITLLDTAILCLGGPFDGAPTSTTMPQQG